MYLLHDELIMCVRMFFFSLWKGLKENNTLCKYFQTDCVWPMTNLQYIPCFCVCHEVSYSLCSYPTISIKLLPVDLFTQYTEYNRCFGVFHCGRLSHTILELYTIGLYPLHLFVAFVCFCMNFLCFMCKFKNKVKGKDIVPALFFYTGQSDTGEVLILIMSSFFMHELDKSLLCFTIKFNARLI